MILVIDRYGRRRMFLTGGVETGQWKANLKEGSTDSLSFQAGFFIDYDLNLAEKVHVNEGVEETMFSVWEDMVGASAFVCRTTLVDEMIPLSRSEKCLKLEVSHENEGGCVFLLKIACKAFCVCHGPVNVTTHSSHLDVRLI